MEFNVKATAIAMAMLIMAVPMAAIFTGESSAASDSTYGVTIVEGDTWEYTPEYNLENVTTTVSGASWLSVQNGTVRGTAPLIDSEMQSFTATITATTVNPTQEAKQIVQFTVYDELTVSGTVQSKNIAVGQSFSAESLNGSKLTGVKWSMSGAPTGITIDQNTGSISGTVSDGVTSGNHTATVRAQHSASSQSSEYTIDFIVSSKLQITSGNVMYGINGTALPSNPTDNDYHAMEANIDGVTYAVTDGSLPSGITLNQDGTFTGIPGATGTFTVTVTATETSTGQTDSIEMTISIVDPLQYTTIPTGGILIESAE